MYATVGVYTRRWGRVRDGGGVCATVGGVRDGGGMYATVGVGCDGGGVCAVGDEARAC